MVGGKDACKADDTRCESFSAHREGTDSFSNSVSHPGKMISIDCEASRCTYNNNYKCTTEHVDIRGCQACNCGETACATFAERK